MTGNSLGSNNGGGTGQSVGGLSGSGCVTIQEVETFSDAKGNLVAGQTVFTLLHDPSGDVTFTRTGATTVDEAAISPSGNDVIYDPAANGGNAILATDTVTISYLWEDCTASPATDPVVPPIPDAFDNSIWLVNPLDMSELRGASGEVTIVAGSTLAIPDGQVVGQRRNITFIGGATQFSEMIITGKFRGYGRNSKHQHGGVQNVMIVRSDEPFQFVWTGAYWRIIASKPCLFPRPTAAFPTVANNWQEELRGTVRMTLFSSGNPVGATYPLSQAIVMPIVLVNSSYLPVVGFARSGVGPITQGQSAGYADLSSRGLSSFNLVRLVDTPGGSMLVNVEQGIIDYLALGTGVASF